jgi:hypothetical protein
MEKRGDSYVKEEERVLFVAAEHTKQHELGALHGGVCYQVP